MNSHFQSSATTSTRSGFASAGTGLLGARRESGRKGSSVCVLIQVMAPSAMMISSGTVQITTSSWVEWCQSGS